MLPLEGIRVVALEHAVAAPICSRHMADLGATVIKIERPGEGDFARSYDSFVHGQASFFIWLNRGKRSVTLDVKHPEAARVLENLIGGADVLRKIDLESIRSEGYAFLMEMKFNLHRTGTSFREFPIIFHEREAGKSKFSRKILYEGMRFPLKAAKRRVSGK